MQIPETNFIFDATYDEYLMAHPKQWNKELPPLSTDARYWNFICHILVH